MKLILAGYNIDSSLIASLGTESASPEVISAAYARISRSTKSVDELRADALTEVEKARKSNENIIFDMGHASVAEHAVFNLDLIDVSRLLTETVQRSRLASFTEKSQRYVTFRKDYVIPSELDVYPSLRKDYIKLVNKLFKEYEESYRILKERYQKSKSALKPRQRANLAKEDARYILPLATHTQMGITMNARSLENLLRRLSRSPLAEAHQLKELIMERIKPIAPSLIRHTETDGFSGNVDLDSLGYTDFLQQELFFLSELFMHRNVNMIDCTDDADDQVLTALIFAQGELNWFDNYGAVKSLPQKTKKKLWEQVFRGIKPWHKMPRAFETAEFEFELCMSESCWAQFKRHRPCTLIKRETGSAIPLIPSAIYEGKRSGIWQKLIDEKNLFVTKLPEDIAPVANYLKCNLDVCRVYAKMNLREIYHFVRLRSDEHAQWEIRELSQRICEIVRIQAPFAASRLCGKSEF